VAEARVTPGSCTDVSIYATSLRLNLNGSAVVVRCARRNGEVSARAFMLPVRVPGPPGRARDLLIELDEDSSHNLCCLGEDRVGNRHADGSRSLEICDEFELVWYANRQILRTSTLRYLRDVVRCSTG